MRLTRILPTLALLAFTQGLTAQQLTIGRDPRLDMLQRRQAEVNKEAERLSTRTGPGFRVLVVNTNDRTRAMEVKSRMMAEFPEHKAYLVYQSPYFKIMVGNLRERPEAEELRRRIQRLYPNGVMVVPARVEYRAERDDTFPED
jgi:hypothetical protein